MSKALLPLVSFLNKDMKLLFFIHAAYRRYNSSGVFYIQLRVFIFKRTVFIHLVFVWSIVKYKVALWRCISTIYLAAYSLY